MCEGGKAIARARQRNSEKKNGFHRDYQPHYQGAESETGQQSRLHGDRHSWERCGVQSLSGFQRNLPRVLYGCGCCGKANHSELRRVCGQPGDHNHGNGWQV